MDGMTRWQEVQAWIRSAAPARDRRYENWNNNDYEGISVPFRFEQNFASSGRP